MYRFQICQLVVIYIDAGAEEEAGVSTIYDLGGAAKFDKVGLVFLISGCDKAVNLGGRSGGCGEYNGDCEMI